MNGLQEDGTGELWWASLISYTQCTHCSSVCNAWYCGWCSQDKGCGNKDRLEAATVLRDLAAAATRCTDSTPPRLRLPLSSDASHAPTALLHMYFIPTQKETDYNIWFCIGSWLAIWSRNEKNWVETGLRMFENVCRPSESGTVPINHLSSHLIATSAWDGRLKICASISVRYFGFWDKKRTFDHIWPIIHFVKQIEESSGVSQLADHFMLIRHFVITFADHTLGWLCIFPNREKSVVESTKGNLLITFMLRKTRCGQDKHNCCNY